MKTWFAAHVAMYVELEARSQRTYPAWENIVLVEADSEDEAFAKAERKGRESAGDDGGTFTWGGIPAKWVFGGVRKLTRCEDEHERPGDGTEVTYVQLQLGSEKNLRKWIESEKVSVTLDEGFPDEEKATSAPPRRESESARLLRRSEEASTYLREHAGQIRKAVIIPHAFLIPLGDGVVVEGIEAGLALHMTNGGVRFLTRDVAETVLNDGILHQLRIKIELPK
jgi:hypothetical protein